MKLKSQVLGATLAVGGALALAGMTSTSAFAAQQPNCDRACLKGHVDNFLDALLAHNPGAVPVASDYKVIFNGKPAKLGQNDIWKVVDKVAFHQYMMDTVKEQVAFMGVVVHDHKRGTFFLRLVPNKEGKIELVEMIAGTRTLDGIPGLISPNPFYNYVLPEKDRVSREDLVKIADSYFQGLQIHDGSNVPITKDCRRFEDGVQTSLNPVFLPIACNYFKPFTYMDATANRIYPVVDAARGLVLGQMVIQVSQNAGPPSADSSKKEEKKEDQPKPQRNFYRPDPKTGMVMPGNEFRNKPHDTIIHELFKIVDGKIAEIQTIRLDRPYGWGGGWVGERGAVSLNAAATTSSSAATGVAGDWKVDGSANNYPISITCSLKEEGGGKLGGSCTGNDLPQALTVSGTESGDSVKFGYQINYQGQDLAIEYDGKLSADNKITGNILVNGMSGGQFTATKQ